MLKLLALLLPALIDLINRKIQNTDARFWVSVGVCAVFGILLNFVETNMFQGFQSIQDVFNGVSDSVLIVFGLAQLSYKALWKTSDLRNDLGLNAKNQ